MSKRDALKSKTSGYLWSKKEDEIVINSYKLMTKNNYVNFLPHRTWESVKARAGFLKVTKNLSWTKEEDLILETLAPIMRFTEISKRLKNKSIHAVKHRAVKLKILPFDKLQVDSETKFCSSCQKVKDKSEFIFVTSRSDNRASYCKSCQSKYGKEEKNVQKRKQYNLKVKDKRKSWNKKYYESNKELFNESAAKRRALKRKAVPKWYDYKKVKRVYQEARKRGWHVDHIVPIVSDKVCGLHTYENLQLLEPELNRIKNNHWWPEMAEEKA